ncbi:MAG: YqaE/Pmp3 family membrane protein [Saprospiraceae bacterium]
MKQFSSTIICLLLFVVGLRAEVSLKGVPVSNFAESTEISAIDPALMDMGLEQFLDLTPAKFKAMTGKKMGVKNAMALKVAQKRVKKDLKKNGYMGAADTGDISKGVYILLAILGLAWVAMGIFSDWSGSDWLVNLLLTVLCWLPGLIHALVKMDDYYG